MSSSQPDSPSPFADPQKVAGVSSSDESGGPGSGGAAGSTAGSGSNGDAQPQAERAPVPGGAWRIPGKLLILGAWTLTCYGMLQVGTWFRREPRARGDHCRTWTNRWGRGVCRVMGVRISVQGTPPEGSLLVSNHLGYLDIPVLASQVHALFLSKAEVADWPVMGFVARQSGTLFVKRERKRDLPQVAAQIAEELGSGGAVVLFPEGTSSAGDSVLPFRASLLDPLARGDLPVSYAHLTYTTPPGSPPSGKCVAWWGDMPFGGHFLGLLRLPYVLAEVRFGPEPLSHSDRKVLALRLWKAVQSLQSPTST